MPTFDRDVDLLLRVRNNDVVDIVHLYAAIGRRDRQDIEHSDSESVVDEDDGVMVQNEGAAPTDPFSSGSSSPTEPNMSAKQRLEA